MKMRKIISLLLVLVMLCSVIPFTTLAEGETVNSADFDTITTTQSSGGDGSYTNTYTTTNGWTTVNSAIQTGGASVLNPAFPVVGPDKTHKAVCMNGKTSAPGKITSPTLTGGITKLTVNYTKMFTDTKLSATVTLTDLATGATYTHTIAKEADKNTKYEVWTDEWVLDTPITGDFTIQMVNDCPSGATGNKDRMTILGITWEGAPEAPAAPSEATYVIADLDLPTTATKITDFALDETVSISVGMGTKKDDLLRVYANQPFTFTSTTPISAVKLIARVSATADSTFRVETSEDGTTWTTSHESIVQPAVEGEIEFSFETPVKYFRILPVKQMRVRSITLTFGAGSSTPETPDVPETPEEPEKPTNVLTIKEAIDMGSAMAHNTYTTEKYYVTGKITEVYNTQYGNMKITDDEGNILTIYGTYSADGSTRYDAMDVKPVAGDTVTIFGIVGQYNGTPQIKNGWITEHTPAGTTPEVPEQPEQPEVPETPAYTVVTAPVAGTPYKFGMIQEKVSATDVYYLKGGMNGYYMDTNKDVNVAIDVYLEETTGGYYMYTLNGENKLYINMVVSNTHVNGAYEATASTVYTFNAEKQTVIAVVNDTEYWFGTRNDKTYTTVGPCAVSYNGFYCKFYAAPAAEPEKPETPTEGTIVFDDTSKRTEFTTEIQIWTENGVTVTNEKAASRSNVADYFKPARFYAASSLKVEFTGMKTLLFKCNTAGHAEALFNSISADGVKVTIAGTEVLIELAEASDVFFIETLAAQVRVDSITVSTGTQDAPVEPEKPEVNDPTADTELSIKDAIALGASKEHNVYTEGKYYVTGVITEVYNDTYGNMYIVDAEGNTLMIYGTYSADGTLRYDAMEVKPVAGDTVKIYGIIGQYNGNPQMKNGWIVEHTPAQTPEQPEQPEQPEPPKTGDFAIIAMASLLALSGAAVCLLKKKEF